MSQFSSLLTHQIISSKLSGEMPTYFNSEEMNTILSEELRTKDYQTWFLIYFLYHTGARITEAVGDHETKDGVNRIIHPGAYVRDIDFHNRIIHIRTLKRATYYRSIPLQPESIGELAAWITEKGLNRESKLFNFNRRAAYCKVKRACEFAGFEDPPTEKRDGKSLKSKQRRNLPHSMRHSFAVAAISSGVPLMTVSEWLGHKDVLNTLIYVKLVARDSAHFINQVRF